jgi:hypothetical protein
MNLNHERLVIDQEPRRLLFSSEPYPVLLKTGMTVAADVILHKGKSRVNKSLIISPYSLANPLTIRMIENSNKLTGIELWIYKSGSEKTSSYVVED